MAIERQSIGKEKAIALAESHWWELCSDRDAVEFLGERGPPTLREVMELIPAEKRLVILVE